MRQRLIIHIGMHKTGSTSIQRFFARNRLALRLASVFYPQSIGPDGRRQPKHGAIFTAISHEADHGAPHPGLGPAADLIQATARRIEASGARVAVLSAEGFSGERPVFARALAPLGRRFDVSVIVFLRRPDHWLESFHRQMIVSREVRETRPIREFLAAETTRRHLDYLAILDWWADAFGPGALRVLPYGPAAGSPAAAPLRQFVDAAGLPRWILALPHAHAWLNVSPPAGEVAALLQANRVEKGLSEHACGGGRPPAHGGDSAGESDPVDPLRLSRSDRVAIADMLKTAWKDRFSGSIHSFNLPPFIHSMLEEMSTNCE